MRVDGSIAQLFHPVALELVEPAEAKIRIDEASLQAESDERAERVEAEPAHDSAEGAERLSASSGGIGQRELRVLLLQERGQVRLKVIVEIHSASPYPAILMTSRHRGNVPRLRIESAA